MLTRDSKATIDGLSREELSHELNLKNSSRFQGEKYAYLQTRLDTSLNHEQDAQKNEETAQKKAELRLNRVSVWLAVITSLFGLLFGSGWYQEYQKNQRAQVEANARLVADYLQPIATLLADNEVIYQELRAEPYIEQGWGILESYLIKIRRDGVPKHALMKKCIDTLVQNNETIITLLTKYAASIRTESFRTQAAKFRDHAIRYNDR
jgi:hypothetical protein